MRNRAIPCTGNNRTKKDMSVPRGLRVSASVNWSADQFFSFAETTQLS